MNPLRAYRQNHEKSMSSIDLILEIFEAMLSQLERADTAMLAGDASSASRAMAKVQVALQGIAAGHVGVPNDLSSNFLRLYEFVCHRLSVPTQANVADARSILEILRTSFEQIREEANVMEQTGSIRPLLRTLELSA